MSETVQSAVKSKDVLPMPLSDDSSLTRRSFIKRGGGFLAGHWFLTSLTAGGLGALSWAEYDTLKLERNHWDLYYPQLPSALDNKTILHLSDLHLECLQISADRLYQAVAPVQPDIVVFTGDLISTRTDLDKVAPYLEQIKGTIGNYFVMGNNDYAHFSNALFDRYVDLLYTLGWTPLMNDAIDLPELSLTVIGIDDPATARDDTKKAYEKSGLLQGTKNVPAPFRLVLAHSTDCLDDIVRYGGADLFLTGHTHGGQIRLPGCKPFVNNTYLGSHGFYEGYHIINDVPLYISRGIGTSSIPLRLGAKPEITLFSLHQGEGAGKKRR